MTDFRTEQLARKLAGEKYAETTRRDPRCWLAKTKKHVAVEATWDIFVPAAEALITSDRAA